MSKVKKVVLVVLVLILAVSFEACKSEKQTDNVPAADAVQSTDSGDYMYQYLQSLDSDSAREGFLSFWHYSVTYCRCIENELKAIDNTQSFEFDPTDERQIPPEIADVYSFSDLGIKNKNNVHQNILLKIDGTNVQLSYDDIVFYPNSYSYQDVQEMVNSFKTEE